MGGIPTRWTAKTPRILAPFGFLTSYQHHVFLAAGIIRLFPLGWLAFVTRRMGKSLPVLAHSLISFNSDACFTHSISSSKLSHLIEPSGTPLLALSPLLSLISTPFVTLSSRSVSVLGRRQVDPGMPRQTAVMAGLTDAPLTEDDSPLTFLEETPLLSGDAAPAAVDDEDPRDKYKWRVMIGAFSILFMIELADGISTPAWNALLEKGLCAEAYPEIARFLTAGDENPLCKDPAIQGKLALYRGWAYTLDCLPTILLALPFGSLSDRWGRKPIAILAIIGIALGMVWYEVVFYFPLPMWTFTLSFVFNFIGGGSAVGMSMIYTMLADVLHVEEM